MLKLTISGYHCKDNDDIDDNDRKDDHECDDTTDQSGTHASVSAALQL